MLDWLREHSKEEDWSRIEEEIFAPLDWGTRDPDAVSDAVLDEEMSLFAAFSQQNKALGG